jgi:hypothetical protein
MDVEDLLAVVVEEGVEEPGLRISVVVAEEETHRVVEPSISRVGGTMPCLLSRAILLLILH